MSELSVVPPVDNRRHRILSLHDCDALDERLELIVRKSALLLHVLDSQTAEGDPNDPQAVDVAMLTKVREALMELVSDVQTAACQATAILNEQGGA